MGEPPFGSIWDVSTGNLQVFPHVLGEMMINQGCVHPKGAAIFPPLGERLSPSLLERQQATHGEIMGRSWGDHGEIMGSDFFFFLNWLIYRSCFFFSPEKVLNGWWAFPPLNWQWACPTSGQSHSASGAMFRKTLSGWWFGTFFIFPYIWFLRNHQPAIFWCFFPMFPAHMFLSVQPSEQNIYCGTNVAACQDNMGGPNECIVSYILNQWT